MNIEIRSDNTIHIAGYVNAVERDSRPVVTPVGRVVEQIKAGVFEKAVRAAENVDILENHDRARKLGCTADGTLELREDAIGLRAEATISDEGIIAQAKKGLIKGWSFGFTPLMQEIEQRAGDIPRRHILGMKLSEVTLVTGNKVPCYNGTLVEYRATDTDEAESVEFRTADGEEVEIIDNSAADEEERTLDKPDFSWYDRKVRELELRYNPYHDPSNGRFTSGGGVNGGSGKGAVLYVAKGQKGKGQYVYDRDMYGEDIDDMYEEYKKSKVASEATKEDEKFGNMESQIKQLKTAGVENNPVGMLNSKLSDEEIIDKLAGGDLTGGSCVSLAYAYIGNKAGYDVTDYRGGDSQKTFSRGFFGLQHSGIEEGAEKDFSWRLKPSDILSSIKSKDDGQYLLVTGSHAAIVKKEGKNVSYLEMQSGKSDGNGFKKLTATNMRSRFGIKPGAGWSYINEISNVSKAKGFKDMLGYLNTATDKQQKGKWGYEK